MTSNHERWHYILQGRKGGARGGPPAGETEMAVIEEEASPPVIAALHLQPKGHGCVEAGGWHQVAWAKGQES